MDFLIALGWAIVIAVIVFTLFVYFEQRARRRTAAKWERLKNRSEADMMREYGLTEQKVSHGFRSDYIHHRNSRFEQDRRAAAKRDTYHGRRRQDEGNAVYYPVISPDMTVPPTRHQVQTEPERNPYATGGETGVTPPFTLGGVVANTSFFTGGSDASPDYKPSTPSDGGAKSDWSPSSDSGSSGSSDSGSSGGGGSE